MWRRYVALGDSFTEGLMDDVGPGGRHRGWADRVAQALDAQEPGLRYANLAVRGRTAPQIAAEQVPAAVSLRPDLVTLGMGINDTLRRRYDPHVTATHLENSVRALRSTDADVVLFAFGDPSRRSMIMGKVRDRIETANAATLSIAKRYGCRVVDFWGCAVFDADSVWDEDRLHLSPEGHAIAAAAVLEELGVGDDAWRTPFPEPPPHAAARFASHARWAGGHLAPWLVRRVRGRSSGDGVTPKRPDLGPVAQPGDARSTQGS